jgi:hypothetical protein
MKNIHWLLLPLILAGCAAQGTKQQARPTAEDDPTAHCYDRLEAAHPALAPLAAKVGSLVASDKSTFEMLASQEKASEADKPLLSQWAAARQECLQSGRAFRAQYAPPGWADAIEAGQSAAMVLIARLYAGEITYGEFNRSRREAAARALEQLRAVNERDTAARQQVQQDAAADALLIQQMLRPTIMSPRAPVTCNSYSIGGRVSTTCQ